MPPVLVMAQAESSPRGAGGHVVARVADHGGVIERGGEIQGADQFLLVGGRHEHHAGLAAEKRQIQKP